MFGSPVERIGQRVGLRLLEEHRVLDDRAGLLRYAVEQPAVVVAVEARLGVVDRERADELIVEEQRADER